MYFTRLPDHKDPSFDEKAHFSRFRHHNIVFNARAERAYDVSHIGCLSIKMILTGEEWYTVGGRKLALRPGHFLILNNDQDYSCRADKGDEVRIWSVFFKTAFAAAVFRDTLLKEEELLDAPFDTGDQGLEFFQTLYEVDDTVRQNMTGLIAGLDRHGYDETRVDIGLIVLLQQLIYAHKKEVKRIDRVEAIRPSTRREIFRRLCVAKDFLHSSFMDSADLNSISQAACLSTPQLVRQFKAVFHITPHQYLTRIRLSHAAGLLENTTAPVHEITWRCGFEDTSAFCRAFRTEYGVPPRAFRRSPAPER